MFGYIFDSKKKLSLSKTCNSSNTLTLDIQAMIRVINLIQVIQVIKVVGVFQIKQVKLAHLRVDFPVIFSLSLSFNPICTQRDNTATFYLWQ